MSIRSLPLLIALGLCARISLAQAPTPGTSVPEITPPAARPATSPTATPAPAAANTPSLRPPPPEPEPSPTPTVQKKVDALSAADAQEALNLLKGNYVNPTMLSEEQRTRATLQGVVERLSPGIEISDLATAAEEKSHPFRAEILDDRIGYFRLGSLTESNLAQMDAALKNLAAKKIGAAILDLRATPVSSAFDLAAELAKRFCPKGQLLFSIKKPSAKQEQLFTSNGDPLFRGVLAVLVDSETAGASEVIAAALRAHARALIVGAQTTGRAVEYASLPLPSGKILRVATAEVTLPENKSIFPDGVKPDLTIDVPPRTTREVLRLELDHGVSQYVFEKETARMNEAALVAGTNPDLDNLIAAQRAKATGKLGGPIRDAALQRAVDLITTVAIFDRKTAKP